MIEIYRHFIQKMILVNINNISCANARTVYINYTMNVKIKKIFKIYINKVENISSVEKKAFTPDCIWVTHTNRELRDLKEKNTRIHNKSETFILLLFAQKVFSFASYLQWIQFAYFTCTKYKLTGYQIDLNVMIS